jgi:lia operon protein LiaG
MHLTLRRLAPALLAIAALPSLALTQAGTRYSLGTRAGIFNLVGDVRVEPGTGSQVEVEVTRAGNDAAQLRIETGEISDRQTLRVVYPSDRIHYPEMSRGSSTQLSVSEDGTFSWNRGGSRRVRITGGEGLDARADIVVRVPKGADVGVWLAVGEATLRNVDGKIMVDVSAANVTATGMRGTLNLDTGSGDVRISDVDATVMVDAGSGNLTLDNVRGDAITMDGGSGNVTGSGLRVRRAAFDLGSGDTRLTGVTADELTVDTGSGTVDITLTGAVTSMVLDTGSGDVTLRVPAGFGAMLDVDTGSGDFDIEFPVTITRRERNSLTGTIGDGKGRVRIDTGSGDVRILKS